jgi:hypothetical protein
MNTLEPGFVAVRQHGLSFCRLFSESRYLYLLGSEVFFFFFCFSESFECVSRQTQLF